MYDLPSVQNKVKSELMVLPPHVGEYNSMYLASLLSTGSATVTILKSEPSQVFPFLIGGLNDGGLLDGLGPSEMRENAWLNS